MPLKKLVLIFVAVAWIIEGCGSGSSGPNPSTPPAGKTDVTKTKSEL